MRSSDWSSDVCSSDLLEDAFADGDVVAVGQHGLGDGGVVDAGGIGRAEVADAVLVAVAPDLAVLARYALVGDAQVGFLRTPDQHARGVDVRASAQPGAVDHDHARSEEHTSELQSLMRISYAVSCLKKKPTKK